MLHRSRPERRLRHTCRRCAGQEVSWARPQWPGQAAPAWRRRGSPRYHRLTWRWSGSGAGGSRLSAAGSPIFSTPGAPPSPWALPDRCRARTPAGEVYGKGMKARVATVVGFVARLRCVEASRRSRELADRGGSDSTVARRTFKKILNGSTRQTDFIVRL